MVPERVAPATWAATGGESASANTSEHTRTRAHIEFQKARPQPRIRVPGDANSVLRKSPRIRLEVALVTAERLVVSVILNIVSLPRCPPPTLPGHTSLFPIGTIKEFRRYTTGCTQLQADINSYNLSLWEAARRNRCNLCGVVLAKKDTQTQKLRGLLTRGVRCRPMGGHPVAEPISPCPR